MAQKPKDVSTGRVIGRAPLAARAPLDLSYVPDERARATLAGELGVDALRRPRLRGRLVPEGQDDWRLEARVAASVVQPCVVTLAPVTTRIETRVQRRYLARPPAPPPGETEMPGDDSTEPLGRTIDLQAVLAEALALEIPLWPRAEGAALGSVQQGPPGAGPFEASASRPLAGLAEIVGRTKK